MASEVSLSLENKIRADAGARDFNHIGPILLVSSPVLGVRMLAGDGKNGRRARAYLTRLHGTALHA